MADLLHVLKLQIVEPGKAECTERSYADRSMRQTHGSGQKIPTPQQAP